MKSCGIYHSKFDQKAEQNLSKMRKNKKRNWTQKNVGIVHSKSELKQIVNLSKFAEWKISRNLKLTEKEKRNEL